MYREEHPKPQMRRENWRNLNGEWEFWNEPEGSEETNNVFDDNVPLEGRIQVPFCPQSKLSGIGDTHFMRSLWYKRSFDLTEAESSGKVFLHFGAVDYEAIVYVNGKECGKHTGGYVSFRLDITDFVRAGQNSLCVHAIDDERNRLIPCGKQSETENSHGCYYTRTTGIWQTVWLEFTPKAYVDSVKITPSLETQNVNFLVKTVGAAKLTIEASFEGKKMGEISFDSCGGMALLTMPLSEAHPWELGKGGLYDLTITYGEDVVFSYFGLRSINYRDKKFFLNGKSVFQRLVLDQGFYPDGIYTAPSDAELVADIDRSLAMGFNGARLHQKIFEERFLYHADRKGYIVWGEFPNWGLDHCYADAIYGILPEWLEEMERDYNHPSIVGWCPFNETWDKNGNRQFDPLIAAVYYATKAADPTRPCIDTSGNYHVVTDIYDVHDYTQNPEEFASNFDTLPVDGICREIAEKCAERQQYDGKLPFFVSEYGGIRWSEDKNGWGYGNSVTSQEEFLARLKGLTDALLDNPEIFAYCYTQLTDVEQEQNGLYTYDRVAKFPPELIYPILSRKAKIEE